MKFEDCSSDIEQILYTEEEIADRLKELAARIDQDYQGLRPLLIGVLRGAVMAMADLSRLITIPLEMDWMAISSYGLGTKSSGVVRILKDLDTDIEGRHIIVVEDILDSGLTLSWLLNNLKSRGASSIEVAAVFRKPEAVKVEIDVKYLGYDIPNSFVVGYGLDYAQSYRHLTGLGILKPEVYKD